MNKKFVPCVLVIALGALMPTEKTWAQPDGSELGQFMADQMAEAIEHIENYRKGCEEGGRRIQAARANYHAALRSGRGIEATRSELYSELGGRDLLYISTYAINGIDTPQTNALIENCQADGGIRPKVKGAFFDLIRELRFDMGEKRVDDILNPFKLITAMESQKARANAYVHARNLLEIYASGVPMEDLFSAEAYLKILFEMDNSLPTIDIVQPDMDSLPQERFDFAVEVFGKKLVMEAAETVLKLPKTKGGELVNFVSADQVHGTYDIFNAFNAILKTEPKGFVIFAKSKAYIRNWAIKVSSGAEYYDELVSRYGKDRVHEVVESLIAAPRIYDGKITIPDGAGYKTESDIWFLEKLLTDPTYRIADDKDFVYLAASDIEAIAKSKDKIQVIYGRVNDVRWFGGGRKNTNKMGDYFHVYFAGVSKFGAMIYDHNFRRSRRYFGDDAQGLIGELIRVQGGVSQSQRRIEDSIRPDWNMRTGDGYFWVVSEEEWPDYLPIPDMEPARSLDELRAAVTRGPVEPTPELVKPGRPRLDEEALEERTGLTFLSPLNCKEGFRPVAIRMHELSSDPNMTNYLSRMARYSPTVGSYEALSEICSGVANPAVKGDFLLAAVGGLDAEFSNQLGTLVDQHYQRYCREPYFQCPASELERMNSKYQEVMTALMSGDLQRERDSSIAVSQMPGQWKSYALTIGQYEVMSEACSGSLDPAIRGDFFAALGSTTADQAAELDTMIDSSYQKYSSALKESIERQPANEQRLKCRMKKVQNKYQRIMNTLAAG